FSVGAEVVWGADNSAPKMIVPQTINQDAGGQWILRMSQPLRKPHTALAFRRIVSQAKVCRQRIHHGESAGSDFLAGLFHIATTKDKGWLGLFGIDGKGERSLCHRSDFFLQFFQ